MESLAKLLTKGRMPWPTSVVGLPNETPQLPAHVDTE